MKEKLHEQLLAELDPGEGIGFKGIDLELSNRPFKKGVKAGKRYRDLEFTSVTDMSVKINGVEFLPHAEIGFKSDPIRKPIEYKYNYLRIAELIALKEWPEVDTYRELIRNDLWFLLYFIVRPFVDALGNS